MKSLPKILIIAAAFGAFGYGVGKFYSMSPPIMAGAMAGLTLLYGFLLTKQHRPPKETGFFKNISTKIPICSGDRNHLMVWRRSFWFSHLVED